MEQYISSSNTPSADPNGGSQNPEAAAASSESGEAEVVAVAPPPDAATGRQQSQQNQLREEKLQRVNHELRKSKPAGASDMRSYRCGCC